MPSGSHGSPSRRWRPSPCSGSRSLRGSLAPARPGPRRSSSSARSSRSSPGRGSPWCGRSKATARGRWSTGAPPISGSSLWAGSRPLRPARFGCPRQPSPRSSAPSSSGRCWGWSSRRSGPTPTAARGSREPVEYRNGLALLLAVSLPLWLWLAAARRPPPARGRNGRALPRARRPRPHHLARRRAGCARRARRLARVRPSPARVRGGAGARSRPPPSWSRHGRCSAPSSRTPGRSTERRTDGAILGVLLVVGAAGVVVVALRLARLAPPTPCGAGSGAHPPRGRRRGRGRPPRGPRGGRPRPGVGGLPQPAGRAGDDRRRPCRRGEPNHRWTWWTQAWELFRAEPWGGWGAGTFELARRPIREDSIAPLDRTTCRSPRWRRRASPGSRSSWPRWPAAAGSRPRGSSRLRDDERLQPWRSRRGRGVARPVARGHAVAVRGGHGARALRARRARRCGRPRSGVVPAARVSPPSRSPRAPGGRRLDRSRPSPSVRRMPRSMRCSKAISTRPWTERTMRAASTRSRRAGHRPGNRRGDPRRPGRGRAAFRHAVELQPRNPRPWYELGRFEFESRRRLEPPSSTPTAPRARPRRRRPASCSTRSARRWRRGSRRISGRPEPARHARRGAAAA